MNTILLIAIIILVAAFISFILLLQRRTNSSASMIAPERIDLKPDDALEIISDSGYNLAIFDDNGLKVLESREIEKIPVGAHMVESSSSAISRVKHLAADLFKGAAGIPNNTVEVLFKPEIHQGLIDGTYTLMKTKSGEILADAVDASNKVVGKARLIQGGKAKQLAGGAFQLVSIAVAQSHLADIERSLSAIKDSISEVLERQENEDKARITGAFDYLREISTHMKELRCPDELPQQKRNAIEGIIKDSYSWRNKLEEDMTSLINTISKLTDRDTFGTGDTFEELKNLIDKVRPLLKRRELFLNLASAINFVTAYLDPAKREYSKIDVNEDRWADLINQFKKSALERESTLLEKSFWNSNETLHLRKDKLRSLSSDYHRSGNDQQAEYFALRSSLAESMSRLIDPSGNVRIAISYDDQGNVCGAAIL
ncbi:hypothetical protein H8K52_12190 [Undibacterium seohonense]|uniref:Uncharacterized protein n=1 Tax=Undibacterium seohonense TaxID=1344950 RepID=A0ABR6X5D7_9BURK|nr:hypothetical protein [Undibacterium seohonense]MBC3808104.1 hypothetical protein [Undibacterium seohonense]